MKTRLDLLEENFCTQTLGKILENEVNIRVIERRILIAKPDSPTYQEDVKRLTDFKNSLKNLSELLSVIEEMIKEEKNGKNL